MKSGPERGNGRARTGRKGSATLKMARQALGAMAMIVLAGAGLGSVGYSFDARPIATPGIDRSLGDRLPRPVAPQSPPVESIGERADPVIRAKSYFDTTTGQLCHGTATNRICR